MRIRVGRGLTAAVLTVAILFGVFVPNLVSADTDCSASMHAHAVSPDSDNGFTITLTNNSSSDIAWIRVTRPSDNFTVNSTWAGGWTDNTDGNSSTETDGDLAPGNSVDLNIDTTTANVNADPANWLVETTDSPTGDNSIACTGDTSMAISGDIADLIPPIISNVQVEDITTDEATVTWSTNEDSTSQVVYGTDDSYGNSTDTDSTLVSQHSVTLTQLKTHTGYHFEVLSADGAGNQATSGDNTFLTAAQATPSINKSLPPDLKVVPGDKVPPTIHLTTAVPKVVAAAPKISGVAVDDQGVARVEYSTDGGQNWLPVDQVTGLGGKQVNFSFTPANLDDGNYKIIARAIDGGGNVALTPAVTLVIDRLPPLVGGDVVSIGPQVMQPDGNGLVKAVAGLDSKVTLSTIGGATGVSLTALNNQASTKPHVFTLTRSPDSGLWSGVLSFPQGGTYTLDENSIDGAGNKTSRVLNTIFVQPSGRVVKAGGTKPVAGAKLTVYYMQPSTGDWVVWDGSGYGQANPQTTDNNGNFTLLLPAGQYYLKAGKSGFKNLTSDSFKLDQPTPISSVIPLSAGTFSRVRPSWLDFSTQQLNLNILAGKLAKNPFVGQPLPSLSLSGSGGQTVSSLGWLGKPTLLSVLTTWAPPATDQLAVLQKLSSNKDINIEPVGLQQSIGQLDAYNQISGYSLNWLADPDSTLTNALQPKSLPTNYFIDRKGIIRQVTSGVMNQQQILNELSSL